MTNLNPVTQANIDFSHYVANLRKRGETNTLNKAIMNRNEWINRRVAQIKLEAKKAAALRTLNAGIKEEKRRGRTFRVFEGPFNEQRAHA